MSHAKLTIYGKPRIAFQQRTRQMVLGRYRHVGHPLERWPGKPAQLDIFAKPLPLRFMQGRSEESIGRAQKNTWATQTTQSA